MIFLVGHKRNPRVPGHEALDPRVPGSGRRLWLMLGVPIDRYLRTFRRVNAVDDTDFPRGSRLFVLGREALRLIKLRGLVKDWKDWPWFSTRSNLQSGLTVTLLPHPSGKNLAYNIPENRERVREALKDAVERGRHERTKLLEPGHVDARAQDHPPPGRGEGASSPLQVPVGHGREGPHGEEGQEAGQEAEEASQEAGEDGSVDPPVDPVISDLLRRIA